ncbi:hypothetical protein Q4485_00445 [Granulosicoccaceae sp. 1_MG-2023]|nr:hypothetical protein [Granulosicoccaceae sp. 1_MG-2023]
MTDWYVKNLGDAMLADAAKDSIRERLESAHHKAGEPASATAYFRHESDGRLHCELKIYFSAGFAGIAKELGAVPCAPPSPHGLSLLAGSAKKAGAL